MKEKKLPVPTLYVQIYPPGGHVQPVAPTLLHTASLRASNNLHLCVCSKNIHQSA